MSKTLNILLIEDCDISSKIVKYIVESIGHQVIEIFRTGEDLLTYVDDYVESVDLILIDINLAGKLNGIQTISKLQKKYSIPFIYITAYDEEDTLQIAKRTKPIAFLSKPINRSVLLSQLQIFSYNTTALAAYKEEKEQRIRYLEEENKTLKKKKQTLKAQVDELTANNQHLISATWRERDMKEELRLAKDTIEQKDAKIEECIHYAQTIQQAITSGIETLTPYFTQTSLISTPKEGVSGDFPWTYTTKDAVYFAAIDCTKHGVPGAMLAIVTNLLLDTLCGSKTAATNVLLETLHQKLVQVFKQSDSNELNESSGLDIALCKYHKEKREIEFSGAHRPLLIVKKDGELVEIDGSDRPVGDIKLENKPFTSERIKVDQEDKVFIFSNGYLDQAGGKNNSKFGMKRFRKLIKNNAKRTVVEIEEELKTAWDTWKEEQPQMDDVLIMGVQI